MNKLSMPIVGAALMRHQVEAAAPALAARIDHVSTKAYDEGTPPPSR